MSTDPSGIWTPILGIPGWHSTNWAIESTEESTSSNAEYASSNPVWVIITICCQCSVSCFPDDGFEYSGHYVGLWENSFFYSDSKYGLHPYMALFITYPIIFNLKKSLSEQYPVTCNKYSTC